jgi:hypothetical protein
MAQIARNLTNAVEGFFSRKRYLIYENRPSLCQLAVVVADRATTLSV